jgi:(S)-sulfolactate dehydrogenase
MNRPALSGYSGLNDERTKPPMQKLSAVVALRELQHNAYFATKAAEMFSEIRYLQRRPDDESLREALESFDVIIIGARERITSGLLSARTRARIIGTLSIGTDHLDLSALKKKNIEVINSPTANVRSVAEHNVGLVFGLAKLLKEGNLAIKSGQGRHGMRGLPFELSGKTAGIVGYGKIGRATAELLAALGMNVIATSRTRVDGSDEVASFVPFEAVIAHSDVVILAIPLTSETRNMFDRDVLNRMKKGALLINTCRHGIVDNEHARDLLLDYRLAGYGADFDEDVADLAVLPNVVITPHIAGLSQEANDRLDNDLIDRIRSYIESGQASTVQHFGGELT